MRGKKWRSGRLSSPVYLGGWWQWRGRAGWDAGSFPPWQSNQAESWTFQGPMDRRTGGGLLSSDTRCAWVAPRRKKTKQGALSTQEASHICMTLLGLHSWDILGGWIYNLAGSDCSVCRKQFTTWNKDFLRNARPFNPTQWTLGGYEGKPLLTHWPCM